MRETFAAAEGRRFKSGREQGIFEVQRHALKVRRGLVHQFEQLGAGLLLGGINVLIAVDDIQIDGQLLGARRESPIPLGDGLVALRRPDSKPSPGLRSGR